MRDQATALRELMDQELDREADSANRFSRPTCPQPTRALAIVSGKGGVGKSHIALNVSIELAALGHTVCLLDANENSGQLQVLSGTGGYWNLSHTLDGTRTVAEIAINGPGGIQILSGLSAILPPDSNPLSTSRTDYERACEQLVDFLRQFDHLVIDTPTGNHSLTQRIVTAADAVWLVTVPELTSIAETYALMKTGIQYPAQPDWEILVNQADSAQQARDIVNRIRKTAQSFLNRDVFPAGHIPDDAVVMQAVMQRQPFCRAAPHSAAAQAIQQLARSWSERSHRVSGKFLRMLT